jgi:glycosyltransferase involved in cell wall biosynthesis
MTDNKPLISVIVPVYNVEKYLNECVDSILAQTYENLEIILVDDGSPDRCPLMCDEYASANANVKVIHKKNGGASSARNAGLDAATGKMVAFLDSDDFVDKEMFTRLYQKRQESGAPIVCSCFKSLYGTRNMKKEVVCNKQFHGLEIAQEMFLRDTGFSACAKIFDRSLIGDARFTEGITNEDFLFMLDIYLKDSKVYFMADSFYYYRYNEASITSVINERTFDLLSNSIKAENIVADLSSDLREAARVCKLRRHIDMAYRLHRDKATKLFPEQLKSCYKMMNSNLGFILFSSKVSVKYKIKTILNIFHISIPEPRSVIKARERQAAMA